MYFVGVDLAWGGSRPTGLAVLDDAGRLVHLSSATSDEEILATLTPYVEKDCVVAVDAPLIVTNPTGNRPAEAALNADFARFDAGAHPSNTSRLEFREQPRGARIAARLGLDMNPRSGRSRRAIEVYPHPATVALFRLGRTLKYKNKHGRDLAQLRGECTTLLNLLDSLADAEPPLILDGPLADRHGQHSWQALKDTVAQAATKSQLRAVEDPMDAVVCAYIALFATRRPEQTTTYGDFETGYIVTPTLPEDLTPTPRRRAARTEVDAAVREYARRQPQLKRATDRFVQLVTAILDEAGINYLTVSGRAKSVESFAAKAARTVEGRRIFLDPLHDITDQIGIRVITYVHSDVQAVVDLLGDQVVVHDDRDMGRETAEEGRFGYASRHLLVSLDPARAAPSVDQLLLGRQAQVQIRTVLQHAWAEFEHDIRYKGTIPSEHVSEFDRRFTLAAGLLELADRELSTIRDRLRGRVMDVQPGAADRDPRISPRELAAFLAGQYAEAGWSRVEHYGWISTLILELGIASLAELATCLRSVDEEALAQQMAYQYPPGAVRRLDDALLWVYGETYVVLDGNAHRVDALRDRLAKMRGA
jgi:predicted RNase H-like nuclease/ppGpp synthetase/RelA/SpoT-type nucleotidyltranferase